MPIQRRFAPPSLMVAAALILAGCEGFDGPSDPAPSGQQAADSLNLVTPVLEPRVVRGQEPQLRAADGLVSVGRRVVTLWAVRGQGRVAQLVYSDGTPLASFSVGPQTLVTNAAGQPLAEGDSVRITMRLIRGSILAVEMQPAGLRFNPESPAQLQFNLARAPGGSLQAHKLSMWKQESSRSPWEPVDATFDYQSFTATAAIEGFTIYAIID
jgi:hypothetical protein